MPAQVLADRSVIAVEGADAATFLHGLLTTDIVGLPERSAVPAALLAPQGKILFEMLVARAADGFLIDCRSDVAESLARRLGFYRLRASVEITPRPDLGVAWTPDGSDPPRAGLTFPDPRLADLGLRTVAPATGDDVSSAYHAARIAAGVAEAGPDYDGESVFPHEANLDLLNGVDFAKGCFVGQEVVSRMQHRGTARKRFLPCTVEGTPPDRGATVEAGGRMIGTVGSSAGDRALAIVRLDRLAEAEGRGEPATAGAARLAFSRPDWMRRAGPGSEAAE